MKPLNLAAEPFRNERLGEALFALGAAVLLGLTAWHAVVIRDLLPARTSALHREVAGLEAEIESLAREASSRRTEAPPKKVLDEWTLLKELVDRRTFSWTALFGTLEEVIPDDVRLVSIAPTVAKGQVKVEINATVRDPAAGWEFVRALEAREEFYDVYPTSESDRDFRYTMLYRPAPGTPATARAAASPGPPASPVVSADVGPPPSGVAIAVAGGATAASRRGAGPVRGRAAHAR